MLASVEHPFVVSLTYSFQTADHLCLVLDFIRGGNMYSDLMAGPYSHERACFYAAQVVLALEHLHSLDILYRDLKPDNVLLTTDGYLKLADMGAARGIGDTGEIVGGDSTSSGRTAKVQPEEKRHLQRRMTITGTHGYRSPEVYDRSYGKPSDWWNVGILIIEMLTADNPLRGNNRKESEHLTKHKDLQLPRTIKADAQSIALAFLHRDPAARLGTPRANQDESWSKGSGGGKGGGGGGGNGGGYGESEADAIGRIKAHAYFAKIDWVALLAREMKPPFKLDIEESPMTAQRSASSRPPTLDYFCQMVDYLKASMEMRPTWPLKPEDQASFDNFDFVSTQVFEELLGRDEEQMVARRQSSLGPRGSLARAPSVIGEAPPPPGAWVPKRMASTWAPGLDPPADEEAS